MMVNRKLYGRLKRNIGFKNSEKGGIRIDGLIEHGKRIGIILMK